MTTLLGKGSFLAVRFVWIRYFFRLLRKKVATFVAIGLVFISLALLQHWFVHKHVYSTASRELASWAVQIADQIAYKTQWDLTGYRRADITVPSWFVVTEDGLVIDIQGFIPDLFGKAEPINDSIFDSPKTVVTSCGETWRLFGRRVRGGAIMVGINAPENIESADAKLLENAGKFGATVDQATSVKSREIDWDVDYAVVTSDGELKCAYGGVPLKTNPDSLLHLSKKTTPFFSNGKPYLLYSEPLFNLANQLVGMVIVPKDMSLEQEALQIQDRFNYMIVCATGILIALIVLLFVGHELLNRANRLTLEEALKLGESLTVEFKSTFQWDVYQGKSDNERILDILKSIAGFLNAKGGTLFIGVVEDKTGALTVCGISQDLKLNENSTDKLQRRLHDFITTRIGAKFAPFIEDHFEEAAGQLCWVVVVVASAPEPAFVRWKSPGEAKEQKKFYVREGPETSDLDNESTWRYIKNRWG